ncbi:MAG: acyl-ACP--UDP-N-acetylglucosamine O-acyltransferase [Verrucomicrobia bacterium]|nr:acyl-ACP--UDP-N-acetylglucosamine O-acyltransferase [Verrucomicrobiota bacterium]MBU1735481.1 acyl-ACP--UDP-N-acetylglucosamine O-acyltransferase [Verrucomicrobiota bacterium]MBU1856876.1 acyl-ACP--UDP-N-acetylglucosamine O-acyltransferase [Verrucomicrobiota bacterium]
MNIHPTVIVNPKAELGANVTIGPFCVIDADVKIGDNTRIGPHVTILPFTTIGAGCTIHAHAVLGDLPQDTAFKEDVVSYVRIGANCIIREGVTIHRGTKPETETVVGDGCFLMVNSHVAHNCRIGNNAILINGALLAGYVEVGERALISGNAVVHQFCRIGKLAMISGNSAISKDLPPFCIVGISRNIIAGLNVVGLRRAGYGAPDRLAIKRAFHTLYQSGLNVSQATAKIRAESPSGAVLEFCEFVEQSKRGICRLEGQTDEDGA